MFGSLANTTTAANLTLADALMNDSEKRIIAAKDWPFLWKQYTLTTTATTQAYTLPAYTQKPQSIYVTVGSYRYSPKEVTTRTEWDKINEVVISSDIATHYFIYDGQLLLFPTPASSSNTITFNGRKVAKDLAIADVTSSTVTSITSGATAMVISAGGAVSWAGRYIQVTESDTTNKGDGYWYEIASATATTITLTRKYGGTTIAAGAAACVVGQVSLIPEPHDQLPIFEALKIYFTSVDPSPVKAQLYGKMFEEGYAQMFKDYTSKTSVVLADGGEDDFINPNLLVAY